MRRVAGWWGHTGPWGGRGGGGGSLGEEGHVIVHLWEPGSGAFSEDLLRWGSGVGPSGAQLKTSIQSRLTFSAAGYQSPLTAAAVYLNTSITEEQNAAHSVTSAAVSYFPLFGRGDKSYQCFQSPLPLCSFLFCCRSTFTWYVLMSAFLNTCTCLRSSQLILVAWRCKTTQHFTRFMQKSWEKSE